MVVKLWKEETKKPRAKKGVAASVRKGGRVSIFAKRVRVFFQWIVWEFSRLVGLSVVMGLFIQTNVYMTKFLLTDR